MYFLSFFIALVRMCFSLEANLCANWTSGSWIDAMSTPIHVETLVSSASPCSLFAPRFPRAARTDDVTRTPYVVLAHSTTERQPLTAAHPALTALYKNTKHREVIVLYKSHSNHYLKLSDAMWKKTCLNSAWLLYNSLLLTNPKEHLLIKNMF